MSEVRSEAWERRTRNLSSIVELVDEARSHS